VLFHRSQVRPGDTLCSITLRCHVPPQVKVDPAVHYITWHDITLRCLAPPQVKFDATRALARFVGASVALDDAALCALVRRPSEFMGSHSSHDKRASGEQAVSTLEKRCA
jgi:hypothetical protein